jgi:hypothetical protein
VIAIAQPVKVTVDEPRQHPAAPQVDQRGRLVRERSNPPAASGRNDLAVTNRHRLDRRVVRVDGGYLAVVEDEVGSPIPIRAILPSFPPSQPE